MHCHEDNVNRNNSEEMVHLAFQTVGHSPAGQPGGPGRSISGARLYEVARRAGSALGKPKPVDLRLGSCQGRVRGKSAGLHCGYQA